MHTWAWPVDPLSHAYVHAGKLAHILARHSSLRLSIEAHCGLEARVAMPIAGQAREFTQSRADAVRVALVEQAAAADVPLDEERLQIRAWGCSRPIAWAFGQPGIGSPIDEEGAAKNRRVELYLRGDGFEVPQRRKRSEVPRPPGSEPWVDPTDGSLDDDDDDGTADEGTMDESELMMVRLPNGQTVTLPAHFLQHYLSEMRMGGDDGGDSGLDDGDGSDDDDDDH